MCYEVPGGWFHNQDLLDVYKEIDVSTLYPFLEELRKKVDDNNDLKLNEEVNRELYNFVHSTINKQFSVEVRDLTLLLYLKLFKLPIDEVPETHFQLNDGDKYNLCGQIKHIWFRDDISIDKKFDIVEFVIQSFRDKDRKEYVIKGFRDLFEKEDAFYKDDNSRFNISFNWKSILRKILLLRYLPIDLWEKFREHLNPDACIYNKQRE